jgi:type IV pilus assembly protein PilP
MSRVGRKALGCVLSLALLWGCGGGETEEPAASPPAPAGSDSAAQPQATTAPAAQPRADAGADASPEANLPPLPLREFQESDFSETDRSRDPFRSFAASFVVKIEGRPGGRQKHVLIERYALDELKLVGVVSRGEPRALLTDPTGLGWVVKVGDFVGKAEIVHSGGPTGTDIAINWRIDRIRDGDVVFLREDPSHPEIPPTTRVLALRVAETTPGQAGGAVP